VRPGLSIGLLLAGLLLAGSLPARAQAVDEDLLRQQDAVAAAAAAVAHARAEGARRRDIAELMAAYREQAERLASRLAPDDQTATTKQREAAVAALSAATAEGQVASQARDLLDRWLGPLLTRLDLLDNALTAAAGLGSPDLAADMILDIENQAVAVMVAAAHDATASESESRANRLKAAALRAASDPGGVVGFSTQVDVQTLLAAADAAAARADTLWALRDRAAALLARARQTQTSPSEP